MLKWLALIEELVSIIRVIVHLTSQSSRPPELDSVLNEFYLFVHKTSLSNAVTLVTAFKDLFDKFAVDYGHNTGAVTDLVAAVRKLIADFRG
jgi:hypothetical protein